jgi:hypothetical protein
MEATDVAIPALLQDYLVPPASSIAAPGFVERDEVITSGLPHAIHLDADLSLLLSAPTGLAHAWRDADPALRISHSELERQPALEGAIEHASARVPLRFLLRLGSVVVASVPLNAGLRRVTPDSGDPSRGAAIDLHVISWDLRAGSMRGPGDYASRVRFAWRRADRGSSVFSPPAVLPALMHRLPPEHRFKSELGSKLTSGGRA